MNYRERLNNVIPGGAHTYSRGHDQFPENAPQIFERSQGAYAFTPEGERFLDYAMGLRSVTLGYANEAISNAAIRQIMNGNTQSRPSLIELQAAELMVDLIPSAEMVKFAKNGSSVTSAAVKIARAYTGRSLIARCLDHPFFSYDDWFIGDTEIHRGIPPGVRRLTLNFRFNDIQSLKVLFERHPGDIAGVILEPATSAHPAPGFLAEVKTLCEQKGALFILDEMITGFRWHLRGAQAYYEIEPDLSTFGKGMANGFSVSALAGKKEFMDVGGILKEGAERVFLISSTHGAEMCGLGAFVETVKFYRDHDVVGHLWRFGGELTREMNRISSDLGLEQHFSVGGVPCSPVLSTLDRERKPSFPMRTLFLQEMIKNRVLMPYIAPSFSHGTLELEQTLQATRHALEIYRKALEDGCEKYLEGPVIKPVFRRFN
jgi:glutamate-1-semialdehyde 2,1-aminomutase